MPLRLKEKLSQENFDVIFDNNGRELTDTQPLAEIFQGPGATFCLYEFCGGVSQI